MMEEKDSKRAPFISKEGYLNGGEYTDNLINGENRLLLGRESYTIIDGLSKKAPKLVYISRNVSLDGVYPVNRGQWFAELMHLLSQPEHLGELLEWESHGNHIVGYRLTQQLEVVDQRVLKPEVPKQKFSSLTSFRSSLKWGHTQF